MKKLWLFFTIALVSAFFLVLAIEIAERTNYISNDFFYFWQGGHSVWQDGDPYNLEEVRKAHIDYGTNRLADPRFLYPLPLAILLVPFGALPLKTAFIAWTFISEILISLSIILLLRTQNFKKSKHLILPIILANIIFRPTTTMLLGGQISAWLLFFTTIAAILWHKEKWFWGGITIAFLTLKPSVGFPILLIITPWLLARKKYTTFAGIASTGLFFFIIGIIKDPFWIPKYIHILNTKLGNEFGISPTIWGFSAMACKFDQSCTAWLGGTVLIIFLALNIWLLSKWRFDSPILALGHLITISLLSTLYLWPYDHLLLTIPIVYIMGALLKKGVPYLKVSLIFIGISLASIIIRVASILIHLEKETLYGLLPLLVWGITTWMLTKNGIKKPQRT